MNILFVTNFYPDPQRGGIERVTNILAEYFATMGNVCFNFYLYPTSLERGYQYIRSETSSHTNDTNWFVGYLKKNGIDVIINQSNPYYTPFLVKCARTLGVKVVTAIHNSTELEALPKEDVKWKRPFHVFIPYLYWLYAWYSRTKLRYIHKRSFYQSDRTVLLSKSLVNDYYAKVGKENFKNKLCYINNPLSFRGTVCADELSDKENIVLVVARLYERQKKISSLLEIWKKVEENVKLNAWKLLVVGDGEDIDLYKRMVCDYGLQRVSFEGQRNSLPYYRKASIFAMTSIWEGFPMTLIESLQMGVVPIVMDSFPSAHDIIKSGINGILVNYGDREAFYQQMVLLMTKSEYRNKMSINAIESACQYRIEKIGGMWLKMLNDL